MGRVQSRDLSSGKLPVTVCVIANCSRLKRTAKKGN